MEYEPPVVVDYGSVLELTEAIGLQGSEDGGSKMFPLQTNISEPALP